MIFCKYRRNKFTLVTWLVSYILVLAIPLATYSLTLINTMRTLEKDIEDNNTVLVSQMTQIYDTTLQGIQQFRDYLWLDKNITSKLPSSAVLTVQQRYDMWKAGLSFYQQVLQNSLLEDGYLYLHPTDTVLCYGSVYTPDLLMDVVHHQAGDVLNQQEWFDELKKYHYSQFVLIPREEGNSRVALLSSIPYMNIYETSATIVLILSENAFPSRSDNGVDGNYLLVIGDEGEIISGSHAMQTDDFPYIVEKMKNTSHSQASSFEAEINHVRSLVSVQPSRLGPWNYVSITPSQTLMKSFNHTRIWLLTSVVISAVLGLSLAFLMAHRNQSAVDDVTKKLYSLTKGEVDLNEQKGFARIEGMLEELARKSDKMDVLVESQRKMLQNHALERLLFSGGQSERILAEMGVVFRYSSFVIAVCFFNETLDTSMEDRERQLLLEGSAQQLAERWRETFDVRCLFFRQTVVMFLNLAEGMLTEALKDKMMRQIRLVQQEHLEHHRYFFVSFSAQHTGYTQISEAYNEALVWLNYSSFYHPKEFSVYFTPEAKENAVPLVVSSIQEEMIQSVIASGNDGTVTRLIAQLSEPFYRAPVSSPVARCYFHSIVSIMIRELPAERMNEMLEEKLIALEKCSTPLEMQQATLEIALNMACLYRSGEEDEQGSTLLDQMLILLNENYMNCDFNVSLMAEKIGKSLSYISKYFKDKTGVGLYDYLNRLRIEKAKELIAGSDKPISTLIGQAGFQNLGSFIRVFKRYENMTPGAYQKQKNAR